MSCRHCKEVVEKLLRAQPGVQTADVDLGSAVAVLQIDPAVARTEVIVGALEAAGYEPRVSDRLAGLAE